ncbi:hypothetical protein SESBI_43701 [Sesbania bispinosa]|nr:hypothetical protein SESBI_43701 [Sesbania bispinosa]
MESERVENLEKSVLEWRNESQAQWDEIKQLLKENRRGDTRGRSRRRRSPNRRYEEHGSRVGSSQISRSHSRKRETSIRRDEGSSRGSRPPPRANGGRKLEVSIFSGDDAHGWINRVERYFKLNGLANSEKLNAVVVALEDRALNWFQWWEEQTPTPNWEQFKEAVIRRF